MASQRESFTLGFHAKKPIYGPYEYAGQERTRNTLYPRLGNEAGRSSGCFFSSFPSTLHLRELKKAGNRLGVRQGL